MNTAYLQSINEHTNVHFEALDELSQLLTQRSLTFHERNSAQRSAAIHKPANAYSTKTWLNDCVIVVISSAVTCETTWLTRFLDKALTSYIHTLESLSRPCRIGKNTR